MNSNGPGISGYILLLAVQILFLIVYAVFVRYDISLLPIDQSENGVITGEEGTIGTAEKKHVPSYPREFFHHMVYNWTLRIKFCLQINFIVRVC